MSLLKNKKRIFQNYIINKLELITSKIKQLSPTMILIVTGKKSYLQSPFLDVINNLKENYDVKVWRYSKLYPDFNEIKHFLEQNSKNYDLIISYGGGTVIDVSKLISTAGNLNSFDEVFNRPLTKNSIYHLCIPTTFGSGSDSTSFAVIYKDGEKFSIESKNLIPNDVVLDPDYTLNLNGHVSYCSIMDSLCQSIESLWSINNTPESSSFAIESISLISKCLNSLDSLSRYDRELLLKASSLSGKAINITKTTAPHAFSYYLTYNHSICHGQAVSVFFEKFIDLNFNSIKNSNRKALLEVLNIRDKKGFILLFKKIKQQMGFDLDLKEIKDLDVAKYSNSINLERLKNNPVKINPKDIIYDSLY